MALSRTDAHQTICGQMQGILTAAETRGEQLTREERIHFDSLELALTALNSDKPGWHGPGGPEGFNVWSRQSQGRRSTPDMPGAVYSHATATAPLPAGVSGGERFIDKTGHEVAVLSPEQSFAEHFKTDGNLSFGLALRGIVTGNWKGADREYAAMSGGYDTAGGFLLPTPLANFVIDKARNASVLIAAGARTVPMESSELSIARVDSDPTTSWRQEGSTMTSTQAAIGKIVMHSRMLACLIPVTVELLEDAPNASMVIEDAIAGALGAELDRAGLVGTGAGAEPQGIVNATNVTTTSVAGPINGDALLSALASVEVANGHANAIVFHPSQKSTYRKLKDGNGQYLTQHADVLALPQFTTKNLTSGYVIVGDFTQCLVGMRTNAVVMELLREGVVDSDNAVSQFKRFIRCYIRGDYCLAHPEHFCVLTGVT